MSVLPIVDRELRVAARRASTYWMRSLAAMILLVIWLLVLSQSHFISPAQMGQRLLNALGILALVFSGLAGIFLTSDCLSEEKREGTLGLLFLTDLRAYDVVLGKLAAHSLHAFFGLLAVLPVLGLGLLIGGVTGQEFTRLTLVFVVTLFFSLGLSMAISAVSHDAKQAITRAFLLIVVFAGLFPALWWFQWILFRTSKLDFLLWPSPVFAYVKAFDAGYRFGSGMQEFWLSVSTLFGLGLGGIVLANMMLPRAWQVQNGPRSTQLPLPSLRGFSPKAAHKGWPVFSADEPMFWLSVRDGSARRMAWRVLIVLALFWLSALVLSMATSHLREAFLSALFVAYGMHFAVKVLYAVEASRRMNEDRRSGAWELLLVTPISIKSILAGQKKALWRHFRGVAVALFLVNVIMAVLVFAFHNKLQMSREDRALFLEIFSGGVICLAVDFFALSWVGMWFGVKARQHHRAVLGTLLRVLSVPIMAVFLFVIVEPNVRYETMCFLMAFWFIGGAMISMAVGLRARRKLLKDFRTVVLQRG